MLDDDQRPVGPGTRLLTVVVAPFVAAWMAIDASIDLVSRLIRHAVQAVVDSLRAVGHGCARAGRGFVRRAVALGAAIVGFAGELPHVVAGIVGPAATRLAVFFREVAHALAALIRSIGRALAAIARRWWVALRAFVTIILRPFGWVGRILAEVGVRAVTIVRAAGHRVAASVRFVGAILGVVLARVRFILVAVTRLVGRGLRRFASAALVAVGFAERAVRVIWEGVRLAAATAGRAIRDATSTATRAIRSAAAGLAAAGASARSAIRTAVLEARSSVRVAIGDARRSIRHAFSTGRKPAGPSK